MKVTRVLFIHHSTGGLLLHLGRLRARLGRLAPNVELWDHGYNLFPSHLKSQILGSLWLTFHTGLSDVRGRMTGRDFNLVISNDSPKEYAEIFSRPSDDPTLKAILEFDIVAFKNCFPTTRIESDAKLAEHMRYYSQIIQSLHKYQNQFIIFTPPPLRREATKPVWAGRARELATWLEQQQSANVRVFNFFDALADSTDPNANMLRRSYCNPLPRDSHPNIRANRIAAQAFAEYLSHITNA